MAWNSLKMRKSNCKHCVEAVVWNADCTKVVSQYKCNIDCEDISDGCSKNGCPYYEKKSEVNE
jgi:hypothetical protein